MWPTRSSRKSDQNIISPYNINIISSRLVLRIMKDINQETVIWLNTKFSESPLKEIYGRHLEESLVFRSWERKGWGNWEAHLKTRPCVNAQMIPQGKKSADITSGPSIQLYLVWFSKANVGWRVGRIGFFTFTEHWYLPPGCGVCNCPSTIIL